MNNNLWHGYKKEEFEFKGKRAILVFPKTKESSGSWLLKTEYWNAFPQVELAMLERGFHLAYLENLSRFATKEDCDRKAEFADYLAGRFGLKQKCVPVGFSCGGAHAINFAGFYPEYVSCVFIDAPVLNFCDYPGRLPADRCENVWENEFVKAYPEITRAGLLNNFPFHPLNRTKALQENKIPIIMLYGTEDKTINYEMNGRLLETEYDNCSELLTVIPRNLQGHHPHGGLEDITPIVDFIIRNTEK